LGAHQDVSFHPIWAAVRGALLSRHGGALDNRRAHLRVQQVRLRYHIPTACPIVPQGDGPRGDGLVPVGTVAAQLGVARSVIGQWCQWGFLYAEQKAARDPRWIRLTAEDRVRLDGTLAAQGYGQWRIREAQAVLGLRADEVYAQVRAGQLVPYRAHVGAHWEWRVSPAEQPGQAAERANPTTAMADQHPVQQRPEATAARSAPMALVAASPLADRTVT
jgi:hypothetical protein